MLEGGIVAPMIVSGKGVAASGVIDDAYATVMDLAPTFIDTAGARYPDDGSVRPMLGESMAPFLAGESELIHDDGYVTVLSHAGRTYVRKGRWKIVTESGPFDEAHFALYDVVGDPGETRDLRGVEPEKFEEMLETWREQRLQLGIVVPADL